uniref:4Fe-4S ferredoxin-type domain-containing protein n=1 Tax=Oryza punctata TaxID=4537 RepID=A0A0E0KPM8_ORYPU
MLPHQQISRYWLAICLLYYRPLCGFCGRYCPYSGRLHGNSGVISFQLFPFWRPFMHRNCSPRCLPPYPS